VAGYQASHWTLAIFEKRMTIGQAKGSNQDVSRKVILMTTVPQNPELLKNLGDLLEASRSAFRQQRMYERAKALPWGEVMVFGQHTIPQSLMALGETEADWSAWYRLFSEGRFDAEWASEVLAGKV
jgi:hypothetical protein